VVPVLPATIRSGICARVAVPDFTTVCRIDWTVPATDGSSTFWVFTRLIAFSPFGSSIGSKSLPWPRPIAVIPTGPGTGVRGSLSISPGLSVP
jgi:hypothetical protein